MTRPRDSRTGDAWDERQTIPRRGRTTFPKTPKLRTNSKTRNVRSEACSGSRWSENPER